MSKVIDLTGKRFGRLVVINRCGSDKHQKALWLCVCDCGNDRVAATGNLRSGQSVSCGCWMREKVSINNSKHGLTRTSEYSTWQGMIQRCTDPNAISYKNYGRRGVRVCDRWLKSFNNFFEDMGPKPTPKHTLDRKDNNKGYSPDNCKWATRLEQSINKRLSKQNKSGHSGVVWNKKLSKWVARIAVNKTRTHLGVFENLEMAIEARKQAEMKYWGKSS